jgi:hypothetical protein
MLGKRKEMETRLRKKNRIRVSKKRKQDKMKRN